VSEPEIKLLLVVLLGLGGLATQAGSEAVLPAYLAGLVIAGVFTHDRVLMDRLRSIALSRRQLIREATSEMGTYTTTGRPAQAGRVAPIRPGS